MANLIITPAGRQCPVCLQERPVGTLFLGHAPIVNEPPLGEGQEHPPVATCLIQAGEAEVDDRVHIVCEHCICTPQGKSRFDYPDLASCPTCRRRFDTAISIISLDDHTKAQAQALFQRTVWGVNYITELFMRSSTPGKKVLERVQESYLRHPEKRTWIKVTLYVTALLAAWAAVCVLVGTAAGLCIPVHWLVCSARASESFVIKVSFFALSILHIAISFSAAFSPIISEMPGIEERIRARVEEPFLPVIPPMSSIFTLSIILLSGKPFNSIVPLRHRA